MRSTISSRSPGRSAPPSVSRSRASTRRPTPTARSFAPSRRPRRVAAARESLEGKSRLAQYLFETYTQNPIEADPGTPGKSWVLWDIIATAWLLNPDWVPARAVPRAHLKADHTWAPLPGAGSTMQDAHGARRTAIFRDLIERVTRA